MNQRPTPFGVDPRWRDGILPSSREAGFERIETGNGPLAGGFAPSFNLDVHEVDDNRLQTRLTGARLMVVYKDERFEYTIYGMEIAPGQKIGTMQDPATIPGAASASASHISTSSCRPMPTRTSITAIRMRSG